MTAVEPRKRSDLLPSDAIAEALTRAGQEVAWRNKQLGYPLITWDDEGHVMEVAPEDIPDEWLPPEKRNGRSQDASGRRRKPA